MKELREEEREKKREKKNGIFSNGSTKRNSVTLIQPSFPSNIIRQRLSHRLGHLRNQKSDVDALSVVIICG